MVAVLAAELVAAPLDLDVLAALVTIALVAAVVAELEPQHARHRRAQLDPAPWWWSPIAAVTMRVVRSRAWWRVVS